MNKTQPEEVLYTWLYNFWFIKSLQYFGFKMFQEDMRNHLNFPEISQRTGSVEVMYRPHFIRDKDNAKIHRLAAGCYFAPES